MCVGGDVEVGLKAEIGGELGVSEHGKGHARVNIPILSVGGGIWLSEEGIQKLRDGGEAADIVTRQAIHSIDPELQPTHGMQQYPAGVYNPF